jgi:hypothetical protein
VAALERELGYAGFVELAEAFGDHAVLLFLCGACAADRDKNCARTHAKNRRRLSRRIQPPSDSMRRLYVWVLQPAFYELKQIAKAEISRKLKQRFGTKNHPRRPLLTSAGVLSVIFIISELEECESARWPNPR